MSTVTSQTTRHAIRTIVLDEADIEYALRLAARRAMPNSWKRPPLAAMSVRFVAGDSAAGTAVSAIVTFEQKSGAGSTPGSALLPDTAQAAPDHIHVRLDALDEQTGGDQ